MNTRRQFFRWLGAGAAALLPVKLQATPKGSDDHFYYKGWEVKWTGWHMLPNHLHWYGMYLARLKGQGDVVLYASYPGKHGIAHMGNWINTVPQEELGQQIVCLHSDANDLKKYQLQCKKTILKVIDDYCLHLG